MDLISRKDAVSRISDLLILELKGERIPTWNEVYNAIGDIPSVPAVPLDKLCKWLERYATMECYGCREAFGICEDEENQEVSVCNSRERWKAMLTKWMEEQDAQKEN